jgi:hypothetical protein
LATTKASFSRKSWRLVCRYIWGNIGPFVYSNCSGSDSVYWESKTFDPRPDRSVNHNYWKCRCGLGINRHISKVDSISEKPDRATQLLSPEQITFVAAYGAYKELKIFFVSHVDQHVKNSIKSINRLVTPEVGYLADQEGTSRMLYLENKYQAGELVYGMDESVSIDYPAEYRYRYSGRGNSSSFPNQIFLAKEFLRTFEKYDWFQIDQSTKSTLQAIISFPEKILFRLSGREDLPAVLSVLENLSKFTYAYLPEHKTYMDSKDLEDLRSQGAICLANFVSGVNNLTSFALVKEDDTKERKGQSSVKERSQKWYYRSVFVRFTFWFILTSILTSLAVFLFNQRIPLSPDTMATIVIGGSIASAAALAGLLPRTSKPE